MNKLERIILSAALAGSLAGMPIAVKAQDSFQEQVEKASQKRKSEIEKKEEKLIKGILLGNQEAYKEYMKGRIVYHRDASPSFKHSSLTKALYYYNKGELATASYAMCDVLDSYVIRESRVKFHDSASEKIEHELVELGRKKVPEHIAALALVTYKAKIREEMEKNKGIITSYMREEYLHDLKGHGISDWETYAMYGISYPSKYDVKKALELNREKAIAFFKKYRPNNEFYQNLWKK